MKRQEWQEYHGFTKEEMEAIQQMMEVVKGRIVAIENKKHEKETSRT